MTEDQVLAVQTFMHREEIEIVKRILHDLELTAATDIRVYPDYPYGWHATVGVDNKVLVIISEFGRLRLSIEPALGFQKNGGLIRSNYFYNAHSLEDILYFKRNDMKYGRRFGDRR